MWCSVLSRELRKCWVADFVTFMQEPGKSKIFGCSDHEIQIQTEKQHSVFWLRSDQSGHIWRWSGMLLFTLVWQCVRSCVLDRPLFLYPQQRSHRAETSVLSYMNELIWVCCFTSSLQFNSAKTSKVKGFKQKTLFYFLNPRWVWGVCISSPSNSHLEIKINTFPKRHTVPLNKSLRCTVQA